jgi:hypothetical protein
MQWALQAISLKQRTVTCCEDRAELAEQRHDDDEELTWHVQRDGSYSAMCRLVLEVAACGLAFR